uniref:VWFC domain-containing protein n=1 Tax=Macrostomum lignano TaxID=282301 RepID=A0A1I8FRJ0_9PLAT
MSESDSSSVYNGTTTERNYKSCISDQGELVPHGQLFYPPGFDKCTTCRCSNGEAATCHSVTCSVPAVPCPEGQEPVGKRLGWRRRGGGKDHGMDGGGGIGTDPSGILTLSVALIAFLLAASFCALLYLLYLNRRRRYELQRALLEQQILQQSATAANAAGDLLLSTNSCRFLWSV